MAYEDGDHISIYIDEEEFAALDKANTELPINTDEYMRDEIASVTSDLAGKIAARASAIGRQAALVGPTVISDATAITGGGTAPVGRHGVPAFKVTMGAEFGAVKLRQYLPMRPDPPFHPDGYFFFTTVFEDIDGVAERIGDAADDACTQWGD